MVKSLGILKAETALSRASWLWTIENQLGQTAKILHQHKCRIMHPAKGLKWFTTDKPVIRLNWFAPGRYNFNGGWANKGSEILMPLSPEHMLYTSVGDYPPARDSRFTLEKTLELRQIIAKNAHRYIYSNTTEDEVTKLIKRLVSPEQYKYEDDQWKRWHAEQTESEEYFFAKNVD